MPISSSPRTSPQRATRPRRLATTSIVLAAVAMLVAPSAVAAQSHAGDYVLLHQGTEVLAVRFTSSAGGRVTGAVSVAGQSVPFTGSIGSDTVAFTTTSQGQVGEWRGTFQGDRLMLTVRAPAGTERHVLARRRAGWSDATSLARQWQARLAGRSIGRASRTDGGTSGGGTSESNMYLCPGGLAILEENSVVSVTVPGGTDIPGMSGSHVSSSSDRGRWRVITQGNVASVELSSEEGTLQIGVRQGSEPSVVVFAEQPVLLGEAGAKCNE